MSDNPQNRSTIWATLPLPKVTSRDLALKLVEMGYVEKIEDIYVELTPEQLQRRRNFLAEYSENTPRSRRWLDLPLAQPKRKAKRRNR